MVLRLRPWAQRLSLDSGSARRAAHVGQDREHAPVLSRRRPEAELLEDAGDVLLDGRLGHEQLVGDGHVRLAFRHRGQDVALTRSELRERALPGLAPEHPGHDLGIECTAAGRDAVDGVDERIDGADPLLEQITDTLRTIADELDGIPLLVILREHEDADLGPPAPELDRGPQPVVQALGRHPDVDDRDVGTMRQRLAQKVVGVTRLGDDVVARLAEDPGDALPQEDVVLADHHTPGSRHAPTVPARKNAGRGDLRALRSAARSWAGTPRRHWCARRSRWPPRRWSRSARPAASTGAPSAGVPARCRRGQGARHPRARRPVAAYRPRRSPTPRCQPRRRPRARTPRGCVAPGGGTRDRRRRRGRTPSWEPSSQAVSRPSVGRTPEFTPAVRARDVNCYAGGLPDADVRGDPNRDLWPVGMAERGGRRHTPELPS